MAPIGFLTALPLLPQVQPPGPLPGGILMATSSCPTAFLDTPNNGGLYKAWVTPVADFVGDPTVVDNPSKGSFHGFVPSFSKTDKFKVNAKSATFCLTIKKQLVSSKG